MSNFLPFYCTCWMHCLHLCSLKIWCPIMVLVIMHCLLSIFEYQHQNTHLIPNLIFIKHFVYQYHYYVLVVGCFLLCLFLLIYKMLVPRQSFNIDKAIVEWLLFLLWLHIWHWPNFLSKLVALCKLLLIGLLCD